MGVVFELVADKALCSLWLRCLPSRASSWVSIANSGARVSIVSVSPATAAVAGAGRLEELMKLYRLFRFELFALALIEMGRRLRSVGAPGDG